MFPHNLTLDEVRSVINTHNQKLGMKIFFEAERDDHVIFNYLVSLPESFPMFDGDNDRYNGILRECRGITFCKTTGKLLARKYQKFFNLNERPETQISMIDWSRPHIILEKLDGSMITPLILNNILRWGTKMGLTDVALPVENFVKDKPCYITFSTYLLENNFTPIFEWCSRKQQIVIVYPEDRLVLTAIRDNITGEYMSYNDMFSLGVKYGIDVVRKVEPFLDVNEFISHTENLENAEGYVVRFENGQMLKVKGLWYCQIHRVKDSLSFEKDVWRMILDGTIDDAKSFMSEDDRKRVEAFEIDFNTAINRTALRLNHFVEHARISCKGDKKSFAIDFVKKLPSLEQSLVFLIWDGKDAEEVIKHKLHKNTGTQTQIDIMRPLVGINWINY